MRKISALLCGGAVLCACSSHDPILPGTRTAVFDTHDTKVMGVAIENLPDAADIVASDDCPYTQDSTNIIRDGDKKIFSGFPTTNSVASDMHPVCSAGAVYAGLTTGEVIRVNPKTRQIVWVADVYRPSNMTGGAAVVDIVSPIVVDGGAVYAAGLGDAFCRLNTANGAKKWCVNIGSAYPLVFAGDAAFIVGTDNKLYAVRKTDGAVYWAADIKRQAPIKYENKKITVGKHKFNATNGKQI